LEYLNNDKILACGGSWMVNSSLITSGKFDEIKELVAETVKYVNS
jgi:2-dehydro-3-deoxyphosphogluconate aldolase/(4S)-4-hydroxy-2-oxoglutarate aldolase